jgi:hypothetical protein
VSKFKYLGRRVPNQNCIYEKLRAEQYGCETWFLTLRKEHKLMVSVNRVLRRVFRPKTEEGEGGWRRLHNEELH